MAKEKAQQMDLSGLEVVADEVTADTVTVGTVTATSVSVGGKDLTLTDDFEVGAVTTAAVADVDSSHKLEIDIGGTTYYIPLNTDSDFANA